MQRRQQHYNYYYGPPPSSSSTAPFFRADYRLVYDLILSSGTSRRHSAAAADIVSARMLLASSSSSPIQRQIRQSRFQRRIMSTSFLLMWGSCLSMLLILLYYFCDNWQTSMGAVIGLMTNGRRHRQRHRLEAFQGGSTSSILSWKDNDDSEKKYDQADMSDNKNRLSGLTIHSEDPSSTLHFYGNPLGYRPPVMPPPPPASPDDDDSRKNGSLGPPQYYGWYPRIYPNPAIDPLACSTAYLRPQQQEQSADQESSDATNAAARRRRRKPPLDTDDDDEEEEPLLLCDPDWVLGGMYLESVAESLTNFSHYFDDSKKYDDDDESFRRRSLGHDDVSSSPAEDKNNRAWDIAVVKQHEEKKHPSSAKPEKEASNEQQLSYSTALSSIFKHAPAPPIGPVHLGIAAVRRMNLHQVLSESNYYNYVAAALESGEDVINDAAQIFARQLHQAWWTDELPTSGKKKKKAKRVPDEDDQIELEYDQEEDEDESETAILIFLSIQDHVCFISTGSGIAGILPWWRLDHVIGKMKHELQGRAYGPALLIAIDELSQMLASGPPTLQDRLQDFIERFGVVIGFAIFTFLFGAWGEYRDRRNRWQYAERRSKLLNGAERDKARQLQKEFQTKSCPICLEVFDLGEDDLIDIDQEEGAGGDAENEDCSKPLLSEEQDEETGKASSCLMVWPGRKSPKDSATRNSLFGSLSKSTTTTATTIASINTSSATLKRVDTYGIPLCGADGKRIKLLRCGHIFCETCWKSWVHSGSCGNPCNCPMCRQDVGKRPRPSTNAATPDAAEDETSSLLARHGADSDSSGARPSSFSEYYYGSTDI